MAKNKIQDIVKTKTVKRTIKELVETEKFKQSEELEELEQNNNGSRHGLWFIAMVAVVFLIFAVSFLFAGAKITVVPKTKDLVLNQRLNAVKDSKDTSLPFDLVIIPGEETKNIQGGEIKDVAEKARGTVVVYNLFSFSPQTLSANTRLEGSNGKIYKTEKKIIIPGMTKNNIPGSMEVVVLAIEAGEEYNSSPLDFKIYGFKGTSKYSKIYARSKGEITGGLKGKFAQISDEQKNNIINELRSTLRAKLLKKVADQIPSGYVLFKEAVSLEDDGGNVGVASTDGLTPITLKGNFYGFLFEEKNLIKEIAKENIDNYDDNEVSILNIRELNFSLLNKEISFKDLTNIEFTLVGPIKIIWQVDSTKIATDLLAKRKADFNQVLSEYTNIESADLVIKPIWKMSFPDKIQDIDVIVNYPK